MGEYPIQVGEVELGNTSIMPLLNKCKAIMTNHVDLMANFIDLHHQQGPNAITLLALSNGIVLALYDNGSEDELWGLKAGTSCALKAIDSLTPPNSRRLIYNALSPTSNVDGYAITTIPFEEALNLADTNEFATSLRYGDRFNYDFTHPVSFLALCAIGIIGVWHKYTEDVHRVLISQTPKRQLEEAKTTL